VVLLVRMWTSVATTMAAATLFASTLLGRFPAAATLDTCCSLTGGLALTLMSV